MFRRLFHVSCVNCNLKKQSIKLNKMLNPKSKKQWYPTQMYEANALPSVKSLTKVQKEPGKQGVRRMAMLNKLFMKHITDLMSTGTVSMDVVGRGIEISKVKVTLDLRTVNVFWVCKGNNTDEETEAILNKTAGALRHELSTLRLMGEVPYIAFVKDNHEARLVELDRRLAIADYGEDYEPTDIGHLLKTEFTLDTKLSPEMKAKIKTLEDQTDIIEEPIPEMTHTVFGLDHEKIMSRLLAARKKSKDAWSSLEADSQVVSYRKPVDGAPSVDTGKQKQELAEFLLKRQILQNKLHKQLKEPQVDWSLAQDEEADEDDAITPYDEYDEYEEELYEEEVYKKEYHDNHTTHFNENNEKLNSQR